MFAEDKLQDDITHSNEVHCMFIICDEIPQEWLLMNNFVIDYNIFKKHI